MITKIQRPYTQITINHRDIKDDKDVIQEMFTENVYHLEGFQLEQEHPIILDIGANIGTFTMQVLAVAQEQNKVVTIYAVEPEAENLKLLKQNLDDNPDLFANGSNVVIIESAISDFNGKAHITSNSGNSTILNVTDKSLQEVDVVTYNNFIKEIGVDKVDFLKIDVEGSQAPIIRAADMDLLQKVHHCAIEYDNFNKADDFTDILRPFMDDFSFYLWGIPKDGCNIYLENHHWSKDA